MAGEVLAGLVLLEAFPPSKATELGDLIGLLGDGSVDLAQGRRWGLDTATDLVTIRRSPQSGVSFQSSLPADWLHLRLEFPTPSLTVLIAAFALVPGSIHSGKSTDPSTCRVWTSECETWMKRQIPGRFSESSRWPRLNLYMALDGPEPPTSESQFQYGPLPSAWVSGEGLDWRLEVGLDPAGARWLGDVSTSEASVRRRRAGSSGPPLDVGPMLAKGFTDDHSGLLAIVCENALLAEYQAELAVLRDKAAEKHTRVKVVKAMADLDGFLVTDGLDSTILCSEIQERPEVAALMGVAQYGKGDVTLGELVVRDTKVRASVLQRSGRAALEGIHSSANLRLAISNTNLQMQVLYLTVAALAIAMASLVASLILGD